MPEPIVIRIQPITPLWTGDAEGKGSHVRETGILGSLRWWYEALLRGLGHYACEPTGDQRCNYKDSEASICLACQVFGCTGISRRFRLMVEELQAPAQSLNLKFLSMRPGPLETFTTASLNFTLRLIEQYGALGARTSYGNGVIKVLEWGRMGAVLPFAGWSEEAKARSLKPDGGALDIPSLRNFCGATISLENQPSDRAVQVVRRTLRMRILNTQGISADLNAEAQRLMGIRPGLKGLRPRGSNIFVTTPYRLGAQSPWTMRIFGFVPRNGNAVDQAVRNLLHNGQKLAREVQTALGGVPVTVTPYPDQVAALLEVPGGIGQ